MFWGVFLFRFLFLPVPIFSCLQVAFRWVTAMNTPLWPSSWPNANLIFSVTTKTLWHCCWKSLQMAQMGRVVNNAVGHLVNGALSNVFYYSQSHAAKMKSCRLQLQRVVAVKRALWSRCTNVWVWAVCLALWVWELSHQDAQTEILEVVLLTRVCEVSSLWNIPYPEHCYYQQLPKKFDVGSCSLAAGDLQKNLLFWLQKSEDLFAVASTKYSASLRCITVQ